MIKADRLLGTCPGIKTQAANPPSPESVEFFLWQDALISMYISLSGIPATKNLVSKTTSRGSLGDLINLCARNLNKTRSRTKASARRAYHSACKFGVETLSPFSLLLVTERLVTKEARG